MDESQRHLLVAYDGSPGAEEALQWAAATAVAEHRPLRAVMVIDADHLTLTQLPIVERAFRDYRERAELTLKQAGVDDARVDIVTGKVLPTLLQAATTAEVLVTGSRGHSDLAELLVGSVSSHLARHAPCPVVVARTAQHRGAKRIVVGLDGSADSAAALEFACRRAELTGEEVAAIHGWSLSKLPVDGLLDIPSQFGQDLVEKELLVAESVAGVATAHPDVVLHQEAVPVSPRRLLVDESATASLVVTGSRGHGQFVGMLLGSVSNELLNRAHCPVAIVR